MIKMTITTSAIIVLMIADQIRQDQQLGKRILSLKRHLVRSLKLLFTESHIAQTLLLTLKTLPRPSYTHVTLHKTITQFIDLSSLFNKDTDCGNLAFTNNNILNNINKETSITRKWFEPRSIIPWLKMIILVTGVLRRTPVGEWQPVRRPSSESTSKSDTEDGFRRGFRNVSRQQ